MPEKVYQVLEELNIDYKVSLHEPVFTVEAAKKFWNAVPGMHCKNLFLRNRKGNQHYLIVAEQDQPISLKAIGEFLGEKLSFASEKRLDKYLKVIPGSVTPFGIINDQENHVKLLIDETLQEAQLVNFHPNVNSATVSLSISDFERFLVWSKNDFQFINFSLIS